MQTGAKSFNLSIFVDMRARIIRRQWLAKQPKAKLSSNDMHRIRFARNGLIFAFVLVLLCCSNPARGQVSPLSHAGTRDISLWVAGATGEETQNSFLQVQVWSGGFSFGYVLTGPVGKGWREFNLEYAAELAPVFVQTHPTLAGGGFTPVILRFNSSHTIGRLKPYIELAGGAVITTSNLPPGDTSSFNFTVNGGGGFYVFVNKRQAWDIGCRYDHISNANLGVRNPEFNGIQIRIAYHWFK